MNSKLSFKNENEMLIGAWVAPAPAIKEYQNKNLINEQIYKIVAESGINTIYALYDKLPDYITEVEQALIYCSQHGLNYLACDHEFSLKAQKINEFLKRIKDYSSFKGVLFCDEPGSCDFQTIASAQEVFLQHFPEKLFYVNLLPVYAQKAQFANGASAWTPNEEEGNFDDYKVYLQNYIDTVKPEFLSYDYYPMEGSFPEIKPDHFLQLSLINHLAESNAIPFFSFIQCCSWDTKVRNPSQAEIAWQVNTAIAYGAKGIQYFTFLNPLENASLSIPFTGNILTVEGIKTQKFGWVRDLNLQLKAISPVILQSKWQGISFKYFCYRFKESDLVAPSDSYIADDDIMTGNFIYKDKNAYYIVNSSLTHKKNVIVKHAMDLIKYGTKHCSFTGKIELDEGEGVLLLQI